MLLDVGSIMLDIVYTFIVLFFCITGLSTLIEEEWVKDNTCVIVIGIIFFLLGLYFTLVMFNSLFGLL